VVEEPRTWRNLPKPVCGRAPERPRQLLLDDSGREGAARGNAPRFLFSTVEVFGRTRPSEEGLRRARPACLGPASRSLQRATCLTTLPGPLNARRSRRPDGWSGVVAYGSIVCIVPEKASVDCLVRPQPTAVPDAATVNVGWPMIITQAMVPPEYVGMREAQSADDVAPQEKLLDQPHESAEPVAETVLPPVGQTPVSCAVFPETVTTTCPAVWVDEG